VLASSGYGKPHTAANSAAAAGGSRGYSASTSTRAAVTVSSSSARLRRHVDSVSELDDGLEYLTNLFSLKRACQTAEARSHSAVVRQLQSMRRSKSPAAAGPGPTSERTGRKVPSRNDRSPSPARDGYIRSHTIGDRSHISASRSHSKLGHSSMESCRSDEGDMERLLHSTYSKSRRSASAERVRRSDRYGLARSEDRTQLQASSQQRRRVDAGSYSQSRRSAEPGGYANRRSTNDAGGSSSSTWRVQVAAAELERKIQHYRTGTSNPHGRSSVH
jgi:hypothetical protein